MEKDCWNVTHDEDKLTKALSTKITVKGDKP